MVMAGGYQWDTEKLSGEHRDRMEGHGCQAVGALGPSPILTKCPTNQVTSIPEAILPGGVRVTGRLVLSLCSFLPHAARTLACPSPSFLYFHKCVLSGLYLMPPALHE